MRILHLSDIHYGFIRDPGGTISSSSHGGSRECAHMFEQAGSPDPSVLCDILLRDPECQNPDVVVISGDVGWSGIDDDYAYAIEFLKGLQKQWPSSELVIAPGNHDVNLDVGIANEQRQDGFLRMLEGFYGARFDTLYSIFERATSNKRRSLVSFLQTDKLFVMTLNSGATLNSLSDPVFFEPPLFDSIEKHIKRQNIPPNLLRVCVLHHHLLPFFEFPWKKTVDIKNVLERFDTSLVLNSAALQSWLSKHSFTVVLHGHRHVFHGREDLLWRGGAPREEAKLLILGAGSAGVREDKRPNQIPLSYNILEASPAGGSSWHLVVRTKNIAFEEFNKFETKEAGTYRTNMGPRPASIPKVFSASRMDECHAQIADLLSAQGRVSNFISIVEDSSYRHPATVRVGEVQPQPGDVWRSFLALHPEFNRDAQDSSGWKSIENIDKILANLPARFRLQHGPRLFGTPRFQDVQFHHAENVKHRRPIQQAVDRIDRASGFTRGYVGLYNSEIDFGNEEAEPLPGLMGVQFIPRQEVGLEYLDVVATFRNLELSFWWVVNMLEMNLLLDWARKQRAGHPYQAGRVTFFSALAEWKGDPLPMFVSEIDRLDVTELIVLVIGCEIAGDEGRQNLEKLVRLLEEKARETTYLNIDYKGVRRLHSVIGGVSKAEVKGRTSSIFSKVELELARAVEDLREAIRWPAARISRVDSAKEHLLAACKVITTEAV